VISRPSTSELLEGVREELRSVVLPALTGPPAVAVQMLDAILGTLAVRAAHEIAWMREECDQLEAALADLDDPSVQDALGAYRAARSDSLHLADVQTAYSAAGEALGRAVEVAYARGDAALVERLRALLSARADREVEIMGDFGFLGRG
jgi:hypothetical protein